MRRQSYFVGLPSFAKEAGIKLPEMSRWEEHILSLFCQQFPKLAGVASLTLTKIEENDQNATGYIKVEPTKELTISFPIIIKAGQLSPLDVFSYQGKTFPTERLEDVLTQHQKIGKMVTRPRFILVKLGSTVPREEKTAFFRKIAEDPKIEEGLRKSINFLYGFAKTPQITLEKNAEETVIKMAKDTSSRDTKHLVLSFNQVRDGDVHGKLISEDEFNKLASAFHVENNFVDNECYVISPEIEERRKQISFEKIADTKFITSNRADVILCEAMSEDGKLSQGFKFNDVFDLEGRKNLPSLFIGDAFNGFQEKIAIKLLAVPPKPMEDENIDLGKGVFVKHASAENSLSVSVPLTITTKRTVGDSECYKAVDHWGRHYNLVKVAGLKEMKKGTHVDAFNKFFSADDRGEVVVHYIPEVWKFLSLKNEFAKLAQEEELSRRIKQQVEASLTIMYRKPDDVYIIRGDLQDILGSKGLGRRIMQVGNREIEATLPAAAAEVFLVNVGMMPTEARKYLTEAKQEGKSILSVRKAPPEEDVEKIASEQIEQWVQEIRRDLLKEASVIPDDNSVDKMLSLNFVNKDNLAMLVNSVSDFEETERKLSGMLLASRLKALNIPEVALRNALTNISEVINKLREIKFSIGQQQAVSSAEDVAS
jgi:hypothetical protein